MRWVALVLAMSGCNFQKLSLLTGVSLDGIAQEPTISSVGWDGADGNRSGAVLIQGTNLSGATSVRLLDATMTALGDLLIAQANASEIHAAIPQTLGAALVALLSQPLTLELTTAAGVTRQAVQFLQGPPGIDGAPGNTGPQGPTGEPGTPATIGITAVATAATSGLQGGASSGTANLSLLNCALNRKMVVTANGWECSDSPAALKTLGIRGSVFRGPSYTSDYWEYAQTTTDTWLVAALPLPGNTIVKSVTCMVENIGASSGSFYARLYGNTSFECEGTVSLNTGLNSYTANSTCSVTLATDRSYYIQVGRTTGGTGVKVTGRGCFITYYE